MERYVPDAFKHLLDEIHKLETELGRLPQKWKVIWDKLEVPVTADSLKVQIALLAYRDLHLKPNTYSFRETLHLVRS